MKPSRPYIPKNVSEIMDLLGDMTLTAPSFKDKTGYFPQQDIDSEFFALGEGIRTVFAQRDAPMHQRLSDLCRTMRAHFEADPEATGERSRKGWECIVEMEDVLRNRRRTTR